MHRSDFRHFLELPVRWGDMDALGHVNNVQIMRYFESGRVAYVEDVLAVAVGAEESIILADIQCSFLRQLHYPATVDVATRISRMGTSSLQVMSAIYRQGEQEAVAVSRGVMVWFGFTVQRPTPVPAEVCAAVLAFEAIPPER